MKKICTNSLDIYIIISSLIYTIAVIAIIVTLNQFEKINSKIIITLILVSIVIISILSVILLSKYYIKKYGKYLEINDSTINYNNELIIPIFLIEKIEYRKVEGEGKVLYFHSFNGNTDKFIFNKHVVKKIEKMIPIPIEYNLKIKKDPFNKRWKKWITNLKSKINEHKLAIIFTTFGLLLTIACFIIHANFYKNIYVNVITCLICFIFGVLQFYFVYIDEKDYDRFTRKFMCVGLSLLFIIIVSLLLLLFITIALELSATILVICWATYLLPSFMILIFIVGIVLQGL